MRVGITLSGVMLVSACDSPAEPRAVVGTQAGGSLAGNESSDAVSTSSSSGGAGVAGFVNTWGSFSRRGISALRGYSILLSKRYTAALTGPPVVFIGTAGAT